VAGTVVWSAPASWSPLGPKNAQASQASGGAMGAVVAAIVMAGAAPDVRGGECGPVPGSCGGGAAVGEGPNPWGSLGCRRGCDALSYATGFLGGSLLAVPKTKRAPAQAGTLSCSGAKTATYSLGSSQEELPSRRIS
jgi:hypothetical protein